MHNVHARVPVRVNIHVHVGIHVHVHLHVPVTSDHVWYLRAGAVVGFLVFTELSRLSVVCSLH